MSKIPGWWGVDLDGTLARYDKWVDEFHIGEPIPRMVERVKRWLEEGRTVKILTARVCEQEGRDAAVVADVIRKWCIEHIGQELEITNGKDYQMVQLWDDRAIQLIPNTGIRADFHRLGDLVKELDDGELIELKAKFDADSSIVFDELMRRALKRYPLTGAEKTGIE
jgi:hypothetical protein